jgi:two-component system sensor histidine kinase DesK
MRLLPPKVHAELGFTPFAWLVYAVPFAADPFWRASPPGTRAATVLALLAFLVLYFLGYWCRGSRLLAVVAGLTLLGVVLTPSNRGAICFFIYAAGHAAGLEPARRALLTIGGVLATVGASAVVFAFPAPVAWVGAVFTVLIGGVNMHFRDRARKNAALFAAQEEVARLAKVAERERIARDLHDLLGHTLSVIVLKSELAAKLAARDTEAATREIRDVERISRQALHEVRAAVTGYRASLADELAQAGQALAAAGIAFDRDVQALPLSGAQEGVLALAVREAVTNVVRHSRARRCRVRLHGQEGRALLLVEDDGAGGLAAEGVGLTSMRERVAAIGGSFERAGDAGTQLRISVPVEMPS